MQVKTVRKSFGLLIGMALAVSLLVGATQETRASSLFYSMILIGDDGGSGSGQFSIDSSVFTGSGFETFGPLLGTNFTQGLLSFNGTYEGFAFDMSSDGAFPDYPSVSFVNGDVVGYDYQSNGLDFTGTFFQFDGGQLAEIGYIETAAISAVPIPPSAILFGTALLGLAGLRRRKHKAA